MRGTGERGREDRRVKGPALCCVVLLICLMGEVAFAQRPGRPPRSQGRGIAIESKPAEQEPSAEGKSEEKKPEGKPGEKPSEEKGKEEKKETKEEGPVFVVVPEKPDGEQLVSLSFDQADIDQVLKFFSQASGKTIIKEPSVKCKVTIVSMAKVTVREALNILSAFLQVKGFSMLEDDDVIRIMPREKALGQAQQVRLGKEVEEIPPTDEIVTQIMLIENVDAVALAAALKPLVADKQGIMLAHADTNTIVLIDTSSNVRRLARIIAELDRDVSEVQQVEVIKLEVAEAEEVAKELNELFKAEAPGAGLPSDVRKRLLEAAKSGKGAPGALLGPQGFAKLKGQVKIVADQRTNSVIVMAAEDNMALVKKIVGEIDKVVPLQIQARKFELQHAEATTVAEQLEQLFETQAPTTRGGFFSRIFRRGSRGPERGKTFAPNKVVPDRRTNSVIVTADQENMAAIADLIKELDVESKVDQVTEVFELENAVASDVADTLYDLLSGGRRRYRGFFFFLFGSSRNEPGKTSLDLLEEVNVVSHEPTNTLLVTGPPQTFEAIREIVKTLDRRVPQAFIEVVIADVTLGDDDRFGIEWSAIDRRAFGSHSGTGQAKTAFDLAKNTLGFQYSFVSNNLKALLDTLQSKRDVEVISTPHIMVKDNQDAMISIGESIPYLKSANETAAGSIQQVADFVDVTIQLRVTPHINQRDYVTMDVQQTVNSLIEIDPQLLAPRTSVREANTVVEVRDGQTIVIGGIISDRKQVVTNGVPVLRRIPWIGKLFESQKTEVQKSELIVFLTPHIVINDEQLDTIAEGEGARITVDPRKSRGGQPLEVPLANMEQYRQERMFRRSGEGATQSGPAEQQGPAKEPTEAPTKPAEPKAPVPAPQ